MRLDARLIKIKRLIMAGNIVFRLSADLQLAADGLTRDDALESIMNATQGSDLYEGSFPNPGQNRFVLHIDFRKTLTEVVRMKNGKCRMCGGRMKKTVMNLQLRMKKTSRAMEKAIVWVCNDCRQEFMDDRSYDLLRVEIRRHATHADSCRPSFRRVAA